jgi:hypothetical protein
MTFQAAHIQTRSNPYNVYKYNYNESDFLEINTPDKQLQAFLKGLRGMKSYYSESTIRRFTTHALQSNTYEAQLCRIIYRIYLEMCVHDELRHYESFLTLEHARSSKKTAYASTVLDMFHELNQRHYYCNILSYEFIDYFCSYINKNHLQHFVYPTRTLLTKYPHLINANYGYYWSYNLGDYEFFREHQSTYRLDDKHYPFLQFTGYGCYYDCQNFNEVTLQKELHLHSMYAIDASTLSICKSALNTENLNILFERQKNISREVILRYFEPNHVDHYALLTQSLLNATTLRAITRRCSYLSVEALLKFAALDALPKYVGTRYLKGYHRQWVEMDAACGTLISKAMQYRQLERKIQTYRKAEDNMAQRGKGLMVDIHNALSGSIYTAYYLLREARTLCVKEPRLLVQIQDRPMHIALSRCILLYFKHHKP